MEPLKNLQQNDQYETHKIPTYSVPSKFEP